MTNKPKSTRASLVKTHAIVVDAPAIEQRTLIVQLPSMHSFDATQTFGVRWQAQRDTALDVLGETRIQSAVAATLCRRTP